MKTKVISIFLLIGALLFLVSCSQKSSVVIKFDSNGGTAINSISYSGSGAIVVPKAPSKEGFVFDGWYFDNDTFLEAFKPGLLESEPIKRGIKVYAKWLPEDSQLTKELKYVYLLATNSGFFTGTYEDWLETVRGEQGLPGRDGINGLTPFIGVNGNWWIGSLDTGVYAGDVQIGIPQTGDYKFAINSDGQSYYLVSYTGYDRFVEVPETYNGYPVTSIGPKAFEQNKSIETVVLTSNITKIEDSAFFGASNLKTIDLPNSITSIGVSAFNGTINLKTIKIPDGVTSIEAGTFGGGSGIESIEIPDGLKSIGSSAFFGASNLLSIDLPEGLTTIKENAFFGASSLSVVVIPNSVTSIGFSIFSGASGLTSITLPFLGQSRAPSAYASTLGYIFGTTSFIGSYQARGRYLPNGLTHITITDAAYIGEYAFAGATSLTHVVIPIGVTTVGNAAFDGTTNLTIYVEASALPSGWHVNWNPSIRPVIWGYTSA